MDQNFSSAVVIEGRLTMDNGCCSAAPAVELECSYNSCCKMQDVHLFNSDADADVQSLPFGVNSCKKLWKTGGLGDVFG